jgi:hypothetical protein
MRLLAALTRDVRFHDCFAQFTLRSMVIGVTDAGPSWSANPPSDIDLNDIRDLRLPAVF